MNKKQDKIPVYGLDSFSRETGNSSLFQIEVFDANRHFAVEYPHRHDFFEVLYLAKGTGAHVIDGNRYAIEPPCVFFMSPGQAHKIELSSDIDGFIFIFAPDFYLIHQSNPNRLIEFPFFYTIRQDNPPLRLQKAEDVLFLENLFRRGIAEVHKGEEASLDLLRSILDVVLHFCASIYKNEDKQLKGKGHLIVKRFYQLVEEHYTENWSVAEYADKMALTPNHLTQTVSRLTGKTTSQLIKSKQILEIKRLLAHTSLSVSEIALRLNFPDPSNFTKFFKRETGLSPLQYRNRILS